GRRPRCEDLANISASLLLRSCVKMLRAAVAPLTAPHLRVAARARAVAVAAFHASRPNAARVLCTDNVDEVSGSRARRRPLTDPEGADAKECGCGCGCGWDRCVCRCSEIAATR